MEVMSDAARLRDSTQIRLAPEALDGLREDLDERFTLTVIEEGTQVRLIGSPVEIKDASAFLARHGINVA
jgi:hypothetical protein